MTTIALLLVMTATAHGQFSVSNSYEIDRQPSELLPALLEHARTCELSARVSREQLNIDFDLRVRVSWRTGTNEGVIDVETLEPIHVGGGIVLRRVVYRADFQVSDGIAVQTRLKAWLGFDCKLLRLGVRRLGRRINPIGRAIAREAWASLSEVLEGNEAAMRHLAGH